LGTGQDFEKGIAEIYQECRSAEEIDRGFERLQEHLDFRFTNRSLKAQKDLLGNFDASVVERVRLESSSAAQSYKASLTELARNVLGHTAEVGDDLTVRV